MERYLKTTLDGSTTFFVPELDEHFHSINGAVQESAHVFIKTGLNAVINKKITLFEVGFGTGLNALMTFIETQRNQITVEYFAIEKYPLTFSEYNQLDYSQSLGADYKAIFQQMHHCNWNEATEINHGFKLTKIEADLINFDIKKLPPIDLIYFDAFAPDKQPELWTADIFKKLYKSCNNGAILSTYSAKGEIRRRLVAAGFEVKRLPGPPGKREMLRAVKSN
jgi:tRNA U34 5-methylaminomethyl-2-thiouridine-forming methyltransferase MnmC